MTKIIIIAASIVIGAFIIGYQIEQSNVSDSVRLEQQAVEQKEKTTDERQDLIEKMKSEKQVELFFDYVTKITKDSSFSELKFRDKIYYLIVKSYDGFGVPITIFTFVMFSYIHYKLFVERKKIVDLLRIRYLPKYAVALIGCALFTFVLSAFFLLGMLSVISLEYGVLSLTLQLVFVTIATPFVGLWVIQGTEYVCNKLN